MKYYHAPLLGGPLLPVDADLQYDPLPYVAYLRPGHACFVAESLNQTATGSPGFLAGFASVGNAMPPRFYLDYDSNPVTDPAVAYPLTGPTSMSDDLINAYAVDRMPALEVAVTEYGNPPDTLYLIGKSFDEPTEDGFYPLDPVNDWSAPVDYAGDGVYLRVDEAGLIYSRRGAGPAYTWEEIGYGKWVRWWG